jgi:hypothetical protein
MGGKMGRRLLRHLRGNIVAYVALFFVLSGTAYAAGTIGSSQIANNSLKSIDLKNGAGVSGGDVVPDSLTGAQVDESTLRGIGLVAHARGGVQSATASPTTYALTGANWTQPLDEVETNLLLHLVADVPADCAGPGPKLEFDLGIVGGENLPIDIELAAGNDQTYDRNLELRPIFALTAPVSRAMSAEISDSGCTNGAHFTMKAVAVEVVGLR